MDRLSPQQIKTFQDKILTWYAAHQRDLPWRKSRDPYRILVSEIMLQQTQVSRVMPKYEAWLEAFPSVHDLAKASVSEVLKHWSGLGYNRRALNLKKTAQVVSEKYGGKFPQIEKELLDLPGIGQYTARAIMCFAFDLQVSVVDVNVKKVILTQLLKGPEMRLGDSSTDARNDKVSDKEIAAFADALVPHGRAYDWNQALMDYSSLMLKKEKIDIPKQSTFKGSRRYYRGQIVKQLLKKKEIEFRDLGKLIKEDFSSMDQAWLDGLVKDLCEEGFVIVKDDKLILAT
jgi:A/G-specific adenine glycosylase